jgi:hypothetical protein
MRAQFSRSLRLARFTILPNAGCPQTSKTMALERALPRAEFFFGELVPMQCFSHRDPAVAHRDYHGGFAAGHPSSDILGR